MSIADRRKRDVSALFISGATARRKRLNLTAKEVAKRISARGYPISATNFSNFETGRLVSIPLELAVTIAEVLDTSLVEMIDGVCEQCKDAPPAGFACRACGAEG